MEMSDQINELAVALARAQACIVGAERNSANPFFKSRFADLESVWGACRKPLTDHGLSIVPTPSTTVLEDGRLRVSVTTLLLHASGQWIRDTLTVTAKEDSPQAAGSAISYAKRYALQSIAGVAPTDADDDAEAAQGRGKVSGAATATKTPDGYDAWLLGLQATAKNGIEPLQAAWACSPLELRHHLASTNKEKWAALKETAATISAQGAPA